MCGVLIKSPDHDYAAKDAGAAQRESGSSGDKAPALLVVTHGMGHDLTSTTARDRATSIFIPLV